MKLHFWSACLLIILVGLLGLLPDEDDRQALAAGGSPSAAEGSDNDGDLQQASEIESVMALPTVTAARGRSGNGNTLPTRSDNMVPSSAGARTAPASLPLDSTFPMQAPLRL